VIDAHAHLTDARFAGDLAEVLARAIDAGVTRILAVGEDVASSEATVELARRSPLVRAAVGIHPHNAASCDAAALRRLRDLAADPHVVAIGEIGIDLSGRSAPETDQRRAFRSQLDLAADVRLPVSVHVRDSGPVVRSLVDEVKAVHGYVHCYSEGPEQVREWIARGFFVSFAGTVTFPKSDGLRDAAKVVPLDRLLLETDAPALAPQPQRGRRNEPAFIMSTYASVAGARGIAADDLARQVSENAASLFGTGW
jgi:TatD DNase family protein